MGAGVGGGCGGKRRAEGVEELERTNRTLHTMRGRFGCVCVCVCVFFYESKSWDVRRRRCCCCCSLSSQQELVARPPSVAWTFL